jgi:predicted metal-binding membrane protein
MSLLFVAGVMNLAWVAVLAVVVLLEKVTPAGPLLGRAIGVLLGLWGVCLAAAGG